MISKWNASCFENQRIKTFCQIKLRYSFAIVLLTGVLMLKSSKIRHFFLDKKTECRTFPNSSIKSRWDPLGGL